MRDQDVITRLVELHDHIQTPATPAGEDALRGERLLRRRRTVSVAAGAAAAVLAVGIAQAALPADHGDPQPADIPSQPALSETVEAPPDADVIVKRVRRTHGFVPHIVMEVPGWSLVDGEQFLHFECAFNWAVPGEVSGNSGGIDVTVNGERGQVSATTTVFSSTSEASRGVNRLVEDLTSCVVAWQVQPIAETDAVLASSAEGLIWIQQSGTEVSTLQARTVDGPPPLDVQVEIAEFMAKSE
jgi:hypothetical protein